MKPAHLLTAALTVLIVCILILSFTPGGALASGTTYYLDPQNGSDTNPGTLASPWKTLPKAVATIQSGDTVLLASGIYRVPSPFTFGPAGRAGATTVFKAAPGARAIVTDPSNLPPQLSFSGDYVRLEGLWLGGTLPPNGRSISTGGSSISHGIELVNNTIFGYETGIVIGSSEYLLIQGNRILNTGYGRYAHGMYLSGGCCVGALSQHVIVDHNTIVGNGSGGYGLTVYNAAGLAPHNFIITRNFVAGMWWGSSFYGSDHLIANNFYWKESGVPNAIDSVIGPEAHDTGSLYLNNVLETGGWMNAGYGFPASPSWTGNTYDHNGHQLTGKPAAAIYTITGTNRITLNQGTESSEYGVSAAQLDAAILALQNSFSQPPASLLADSTIESNLATLQLPIPPASPLYKTGAAWFGQPVNVGPDANAPADANGFWTAFRALGLKEYDRNGSVISGATATPTNGAPAGQTATPTATAVQPATSTPTATKSPTATATAGAPSGNLITLNPSLTYQTIDGWEATAQAGQGDPAFSLYKNTLFDLAANDLGINRLRLELQPISTSNASPDLAFLDNTIDNVILPMRARLQARGDKLWLNLCSVSFNDTTGLKSDPNRYAGYILSAFQHIQSKYGFVPDSFEVELEPDAVGAQWTPAQIGNMIVAAGNLLKANGYNPKFVAPSTTNMGNAITYFDGMIAVPGVSSYLTEIAYHRYTGVSDANLSAIAQRAQTYGYRTSMLEHIGSGYADLQKDLTLGNNSSWQQYTLAFPTGDNGAQYYWIDTTNPNNPVVNLASTGKFLRQYFKFIRPGAVRIGGQSNVSYYDPIAFVNSDGKYVVVVKSTYPGLPSNSAFSVQGLPAGTYGIKYTSSQSYNVDLADVTIGSGGNLSTSFGQAGVMTIYGKSGGATPVPTNSPPATPSPAASATAAATSTATRTASPTATRTPSPTATPTASPTATRTASPSPTWTSAPTATWTASPTSVPSSTWTPTETLPPPSLTPPPAFTLTPTAPPSLTPTPDYTFTPTALPDLTPTPDYTFTPTAPSLTPESTATVPPILPPTATPLPAKLRFEDRDTGLQYEGWTLMQDDQASGGTYLSSSLANNSVSFVFAGTAVAWVTELGPDQGKASVTVDGIAKGTFDQFAPDRQYQVRRVFNGLSAANHTITVRVQGTKNASSTGVQVMVDAFAAGGVTTEDNSPALRYDNWRGVSVPQASGGSVRLNSNAQTVSRFKFSGTYVEWVTARGPTYGKAIVRIDGVQVGTAIDLYAATQQWQVIIPFGGLTDGEHTIEVIPLGTKNAASRGKTIVVDAFCLHPCP